MPRNVTVTVQMPHDVAGLERVLDRLGLAGDEVDHAFGLRLLDNDRHIYAIRVHPDSVGKVAGQAGVRGPFASPRIRPALVSAAPRSRRVLRTV
jgi:predicted RNA-binding protein YlqC (UPF0109 family)